jgi:AcrR family transcriptional regulator
MQDIANLLPRAIQTGISVVDVAQLTGLSRPTLYRMLSESRERRPLREIAVEFEQALEQNNQALPADLASRFGTSIEQVFEALMGLYPLVADELAALGQPALTSLVEFLPELGVPERIVLAMRFLQGQTTDYVAASTQLPGTEVLGWAALGLLRVLPRIRAAREGTVKHSSTAVSVDRRYRVGDPRRHRRFDL